MIFLDARTSTDRNASRLAQSLGASITEVSLNGTNYVNHDDPGRQIQTSLWTPMTPTATPGDTIPSRPAIISSTAVHYSAHTLLPDSIYTKTQPIQWAPENFGGGPAPALGDAYIEKWISVGAWLQSRLQSSLQNYAFRD